MFSNPSPPCPPLCLSQAHRPSEEADFLPHLYKVLKMGMPYRYRVSYVNKTNQLNSIQNLVGLGCIPFVQNMKI